MRRSLGVLLFLLVSGTTMAQKPVAVFSGTVLDSAKQPVANAEWPAAS